MKVYSKLNSFLMFLILAIGSKTLAQDIPVHDPVVIKQKDTYYLYCTGMGISVLVQKI